MATKKIHKEDWQKYFDRFSSRYLKDDQPEYVEIQVMSKAMGVQPETGWTILKGITYDPKSDALGILVDKMQHTIAHPEEIYVEEEEDGWLTGVQVIKKDGETNILDIR